MLAVLAVVEVLAVAAPVATWLPPSKADLDLALLLASLSVIYSLFVTGWEKARRLVLLERAPAMSPDLRATWCFASAILLPPLLAAAVTAASALGDWPIHNPSGRRPLYRYVYSTVATSVLAATVASWAFRRPDLPLAVALPAAAAIWLAIGAGATVLAMCASGDLRAARKMLHLDAHRLELTTMGLAVVEYIAFMAGLPLIIWLSLPAAVGIQRYFMRAALQSRGVGARPMEKEAWLAVAQVVVEATAAATIIRITTEDPTAARTVAMVQGGCDAIGSFGAGGLAILLPDCPPSQGDAIARRIRVAMVHHKVACNVVSASTPRDGTALEHLLVLCEVELVLANEVARHPTGSN